jgi:hypothetical protein
MFPAPSSRAQQLATMSPQLHAALTLYPTKDGGRVSPAMPGWGCPCCVSNSDPIVGYDLNGGGGVRKFGNVLAGVCYK